MKGYDAELMGKLKKLRDDSAIAITGELTKTVLSLNKFFKILEDNEIKTLFINNVRHASELLSRASEYLPDDRSRELTAKLDELPTSGPTVPGSEEDDAFGELEKIRTLITDTIEEEIGRSLKDHVGRVDRLGGADKLQEWGIVGMNIFKLLQSRCNETSEEKWVERLRFVYLLGEQVEKIERRVTRKKLFDRHHDISQRLSAMSSEQFTPTSALRWLVEGKAALENDDFKGAEKCFVRAEDGANMALKRREQDLASRFITSSIEKMRGMGLKFSEAKEVQAVLIKAQEAERKRRYSEIQGFCEEAIGLANKEIKRKWTEKFDAEMTRIKNVIQSKARDIDESIHLKRLEIAGSLFDSGMYDFAMDMARKAEKDARDSYWQNMAEKYLSTHQELEKAIEEAESFDLDISQSTLLMDESRKLFLKEAMALADDNMREAISLINELLHRSRVRAMQDEAAALKKELDKFEEKGADVLETQRDLEKMLVFLKKGELERAGKVKKIILKSMDEIEKDIFREELKRILDNCRSIMEEVEEMKGDTAKAHENIKKATAYLTGGLLESGTELSTACLKELKDQRNSLLEERAKTVLYATGEIVKSSGNKQAQNYYLKARTAYGLERYKEALSMAQESLKHLEE